jgi:DNA ligase D-like protein (predicted ligase)/DNA ligase D-like protein (predicted 3'-phosphoesterase)
MLAQSREKPFDSFDWIFEAKWDGIRALVYIGEILSIKSRNGKELLLKFPELIELKDLATEVVLDGEIIVMNKGKVDFQIVAKRNLVEKKLEIEDFQNRYPATLIVFDILEKQGKSLIDLPLMERKQILKKSVREGIHVLQSPSIERKGIDYFQAANKLGLEGIIAKRKTSTYQPGIRSNDWLKIKQVKICDCVSFGYTPGEGSRSKTFGSLILGLYDGSEPVYVGKVGTGFSDSSLIEIKDILKIEQVKEPWFTEEDIPKGSIWVQPNYVGVIGYQEYTKDGRLRAPRFQGLSNKNPTLSRLSQLKQRKFEEYIAKRDFSKTPEPIGEESISQGNSFVVQEHHARRTHWDFRLERKGVLVSWAVPKGIPSKLGQRRLAIQTEDHPLEYRNFEGIIPKGQYGAGTVEIWDKGFYVPVKWQKEKIEIILAGDLLNGRYELIKMKEEKQWLLFKKK